ncbi:MAG: hypothetical protein AAF806_03470 [Bacteroidota bacterium]
MPAKQQYLSSTGQRWLKVTAAILGGYALAVAIHLALGVVIEDQSTVVITSAYTTFFLWIFLMILAFSFKSGWKLWGVYLLAIALCSGVIYFFK